MDAIDRQTELAIYAVIGSFSQLPSFLILECLLVWQRKKERERDITKAIPKRERGGEKYDRTKKWDWIFLNWWQKFSLNGIMIIIGFFWIFFCFHPLIHKRITLGGFFGISNSAWHLTLVRCQGLFRSQVHPSAYTAQLQTLYHPQPTISIGRLIKYIRL